MDKGCQDKVAWETACQNAQASTGRSQEPNQGNASYGMPWMSGQCGGAACQGQVGSGQNAGMCMGQDIGGVTPQKSKTARCAEADGRFGNQCSCCK